MIQKQEKLWEKAKETLFDLFDYLDDYKDISNSLKSMNNEKYITDEEYNYIMEVYDILLDEWSKKQDQKQADIDNLETYKHHEDLLKKTLTFLSSYLVKNNVGYYDEIDIYKEIGFNEEDLEYFGLRDYELEREIEYFEGVKNE